MVYHAEDKQKRVHMKFKLRVLKLLPSWALCLDYTPGRHSILGENTIGSLPEPHNVFAARYTEMNKTEFMPWGNLLSLGGVNQVLK